MVNFNPHMQLDWLLAAMHRKQTKIPALKVARHLNKMGHRLKGKVHADKDRKARDQ
jgi:hypothetical protein